MHLNSVLTKAIFVKAISTGVNGVLSEGGGGDSGEYCGYCGNLVPESVPSILLT